MIDAGKLGSHLEDVTRNPDPLHPDWDYWECMGICRETGKWCEGHVKRIFWDKSCYDPDWHTEAVDPWKKKVSI